MKEQLSHLLAAAGLNFSEYAKLLGVTRVTIHSWCRGKAEPHKLLRERNDTYMRAVEKALDAGELPVDAPKEGRFAAIEQAVGNNMTS